MNMTLLREMKRQTGSAFYGLVFMLCVGFVQPACSQQQDIAKGADSLFLPGELPKRLCEKISSKQQKINQRINRRTSRIINRFSATEKEVYDKLFLIDSNKARELFTGVFNKYDAIKTKLLSPASIPGDGKAAPYIPGLDSLTTMLHFLQPLTANSESLQKALDQAGTLKSQLGRGEAIKSFLAGRQDALKQMSTTFTGLPKEYIDKYTSRYAKEFGYYKAQLEEWKEEIKDPAKAEKLALQVLNKLPAFRKFMQENSELAGLFGAAASTPGAAPGLQTRQGLMQELQQRFGSTANPQQMVQQQMQAAQGELNKLKAKAEGLRSGEVGNGNATMPGEGEVNTQKTKPFLKRLQFGWNLQTGGKPVANIGSYPSVNDLAVSAGYKVNDRFIAGVEVAYKFGLGKSWKNFTYTHEGIGLRSFFDYKLSALQKGNKVLFGNWWISGGYEMNYWSAFKRTTQINGINTWQRSCLLGVNKKMSLNNKYHKQVSFRFLWDFLSYQQIPRSKPFVFRIGYNL